jgi:hypothetical protein
MLFAAEKNPIATLLAFLSEVIGTRTASAAAAAALEGLQASRGCVLQGTAGAANPPSADPAGGETRHCSGALDAMDVDHEVVGVAEAEKEALRGNGLDGTAGAKADEASDARLWNEEIPRETVAAVCQAAMLGAATKAKQLAELEEQRTQELALTALNLMHAKARRKLKYLDEVDASLVSAISKSKDERELILKVGAHH